MYKAIIFDFFDVIYTDCFKAWLKRHGYKREGEFSEASRLVDSGFIDNKGFYERLSHASGISIKDIELEMNDFARLDTDIVEFLISLHNKYKLGLISNAASEYLRSILKKYKLGLLFNEIIISSEVGISKPDSAIFHLMIKKLTINPIDMIFIDDNKQYVKAAETLGMYGIWYQNIGLLREELCSLGISII